MLKIFASAPDMYMPIEQAQRFDQRPFRSMLVQDWIRYYPTKGFKVSDKGLDAWAEFRGTKILRKDPHARLTSYFDLADYGIPTIRHLPSRRYQAPTRAPLPCT